MSDFRNVDPPLRVAWSQALASIRVRFVRHLFTVAGIGLGIAFFSSIQTLRLLTKSADSFEIQKLQWLAGTSLLMCFLGITNSMLMSVTERYREIGTIKCLGASDGFVVKVFLMEAGLLGAAGSAAGSLLGVLLITISYRAAPSGVALVWMAGAVLGILLTLVAAVAPTIQAARMPAAAALRVEI